MRATYGTAVVRTDEGISVAIFGGSDRGLGLENRVDAAHLCKLAKQYGRFARAMYTSVSCFCGDLEKHMILYVTFSRVAILHCAIHSSVK